MNIFHKTAIAALFCVVTAALVGCSKSETASSTVAETPTATTPPTTATGNTQTIVGEVSFGTQMGGITLENGKYYDMMTDSEMANKIQSNCSNGDICEVVGVIEKDQLISVSYAKLVKREVAQNSPSEQSAPQPQQASTNNTLTEERSGGPDKWVIGYTYMYTSDGSCKNKDTDVCINFDQYQQACKAAKGVTKGSTGLFKLTASAEEKALLEGGSLIDDSIFFGKTHCHAKLKYAGVYNGTSTRVEISGKANAFIKTKDGELLVSFVDPI